MANIPFFTYPSFAHVDRFEHSLGVAHLAWRWSKRNHMPEDSALALTLAALYHDGATPAFGHLFEEYLFRHNWDHETALVRLLIGDENLPGGAMAQVFLGDYCKLSEVLNRSAHAHTVTPLMVADIAGGAGQLGPLIKGDVDFDNIDNVIRASSAMGLADSRSLPHPYDVTDALILEDGAIRIRRDRSTALAAWSATRHLLYEHILNNALEFRAQTAFKWAIAISATDDRELQTAQAWRLTDPELLFEHLRKHPFAAALVDRVRKGRPPELLFSAWIKNLEPLLGAGSREVIDALVAALEESTGMKVYVNFYADKRHRSIRLEPSRERVLFEPVPESQNTLQPPSTAGILGVVGVTQAEFVGTLQGRVAAPVGARKTKFTLDDVRRTLSLFLNQEVSLVSESWLGSRPATEQMPLFATAE